MKVSFSNCSALGQTATFARGRTVSVVLPRSRHARERLPCARSGRPRNTSNIEFKVIYEAASSEYSPADSALKIGTEKGHTELVNQFRALFRGT
jgi:hypothetical protein